MLLFVHDTTTKCLFENHSWYTKVKDLRISYARYKKLFKTLGENMPELDCCIENAEDESNSDVIWGNFEQQNDILSVIE